MTKSKNLCHRSIGRMPDDHNLLSLDASIAIPTRVLRFEDSGLRRRTPVRPVLLTGQTGQTHRCDPLGFQPGLLTLIIRSTELTWIKRRSTWAITSKTSPTTPNDTPWSTNGQGGVKTLVKPLKHPLTLLCRPKLLSRSANFT
jgi:hypothetical protein